MAKTNFHNTVADALQWAHRQGYVHGEKAVRDYASEHDMDVKRRDLGVYGEVFEITEKDS